ncbi:DUF6537 domain-containing protein [Streptomyces sp. NPDC127117]|uniref:DUF6537 domain-containing protein n=1 Tax=Streptomyces sp. NPDC127117 TaxID=3345368 RepID=UPI003637567A
MTQKTARPTLQDRFTREEGTLHLTGIQALARLPLDLRRSDLRADRSTAGFVSGYEGSPLAGYDMELERRRSQLDAHDIVFRPGVNEELSATAVQGTQLAAMQPDKRIDGITGIWYGKSPGLDRASDAIRHANLMGTHPDGGVLALVGDDPAAKSSTVPGASELLLADLGIPTLYPSDPQEALDFGLHGVAMSRASGLWVALKIVLGPWFRPVFRVLAAMRHARGTRLDPFGAAGMRRVERALVVEYEDMIARACLALGPHNHALTVELAELPDMVRGYEEIKTAAVARYRAEAARLLERLGQPLQDAAAKGTTAP